jgi:hypothetical protein
MRIAVIHGPRDSGFGGRLRADLADRMSADVGRAPDGADAVVAVVGRGWARDPEEQPSRDAVAAALADDTPVVPFVLEGAAMPAPGELPPALAPFAALEPVQASDEYWDPAVDRVAERLRPRRPPWQIDARRLLRAGAALLAAAASVVGILAAIGIFESKPPERGTVVVNERAANGVTLARYLEEFADGGAEPPDYGVPEQTEGYVYRVELALDDPRGDRFALRWTMVDEGSGAPMAEFVDEVAMRLAPEEVAGVHDVWIPCPAVDAQRYVIAFDLVNASGSSPRTLDTGESPPGECRVVEA